MEGVLLLILLFASFAWAVSDVNMRIDKTGGKWYYVFTFIVTMVLFPVFAVIEKLTETNDYIEGLKKLVRE